MLCSGCSETDNNFVFELVRGIQWDNGAGLWAEIYTPVHPLLYSQLSFMVPHSAPWAQNVRSTLGSSGSCRSESKVRVLCKLPAASVERAGFEKWNRDRLSWSSAVFPLFGNDEMSTLGSPVGWPGGPWTSSGLGGRAPRNGLTFSLCLMLPAPFWMPEVGQGQALAYLRAFLFASLISCHSGSELFRFSFFLGS